MGLPEPIEPQPDDVAPAPRSDGRADWLCGAEEGLEAEMQRLDARGAAPAPKLIRPGADASTEPERSESVSRREAPSAPAPRLTQPSAPEEPARAPSSPRPPGVPLPIRPAAAAHSEETNRGLPPGPAMLWEPGANSVPVLARAPAAGASHAPPAPRAPLPQPAADMDFPMDDAEERARVSAEAVAVAAAAATRASQPHAVVAPDAFDLKDAPAPWWMQLPQLLREDRRVQGLVAAVAVAFLAVMFWPRPEKSLSIGSIRHDPGRYDGQNVRVSGRVGEVFEVGGGHAFYLHQGRDTLVVFTRSRTPRRGSGVALVGMISTGYLNGQAGTALFESTSH